MAELVGNRLVIRRREHGVVHTYAVIVATQVLHDVQECGTDWEGVSVGHSATTEYRAR